MQILLNSKAELMFPSRIAVLMGNSLAISLVCRSLNSYDPDNVPANAIVNIMVKCSCGDSHVSKDYGQFITYPLRPDQNLVTVANEFNLPQKLLEDYNP
ncbi:hypothetical protein RDI58_002682 [Solanum bulbocastanum]|uniref:LYK3/RLK10-like LysM domain-containing protein n=1 Tax=Solanum bulbocastanum TaxID=147425 RepID=A0AAN8YP79_SOLBU